MGGSTPKRTSALSIGPFFILRAATIKGGEKNE